MKLSPQQVAAAKARGFVLFPASQPQIERMTMQRRIFDVNGRPHVVSRDGVYFETHATLAPMIADAPDSPAAAPQAEEPAPEEPAPAAAAAVSLAPPAEAAATAAQPVAAAPSPEPPAESQAEDAAPAARGPRRRTAKPKVDAAAEAAAVEAPRKPVRRRAMAARVEESAMTAPSAAETGSQEGDAAGAAGRRRLWQSDPPRWRVAGAIRRGRPPRG